MDVLMIICLLFVFGASMGWLLELFFRRIFTSHKWINPGFLVGPCLPLYGFGVSVLFLISYICRFDEWFEIPSYINTIITILLMSVMMTVIEYIAGIIFIKGMGIKLWDYSNRWGNIQGIVCPLFSLFWSFAALGFYFLLRPVCESLINWFSENAYQNIWLPFMLGAYYGVLFVDLAYSFKVTSKIKQFARDNKFVVKYEQFKQEVRDYQIKAKEKISYLFPFKTALNIKEILYSYMQQVKEKIGKSEDKEDKK